MRRLVSITTIVALMLSLATPLLAATCEHGAQMPACHRAQEPTVQRPHCESMHHHEAAEESMPATGSSMYDASAPQHCPMNCCTAAERNVIAQAAIPLLPQPSVEPSFSFFAAPSFVCPGFSSHTDRGPPST